MIRIEILNLWHTLDIKVVDISLHDPDLLPGAGSLLVTSHIGQVGQHVLELLVAKEDSLLVLGIDGALGGIFHNTFNAVDLRKNN